MKEQILKLRNQGLTYQQIANELGCAKSTVCYYAGKNQQNKSLNRQRKNRAKIHPYVRKIENYLNCYNKRKRLTIKQKTKYYKLIYDKLRQYYAMNSKDKAIPEISVENIINIFTETPKCYLTGEEIDIYKTNSYAFDHKIPRTRGGQNTLDNLGICTKKANLSKTDMTVDEYLAFCKKVLEYHGYEVNKNNSE